MISFLTDITVDGVALWVVLLICVGVFLGAFMDAIAGGGGIITVPTYLMGLSNLPIYNALGTNKLSSGIGTIFSTARFIHQGLVDWKLFAPAVILSLTGSVCGTWLQHHTPAVVLKYLLLVVLPVVALLNFAVFIWPEVHYLKERAKYQNSRKTVQFRQAQQQQAKQAQQQGYRHKCAVCGRTDTDYPDLQFRYCSKCVGYHCFCQDHIFNHVHFTEE